MAWKAEMYTDVYSDVAMGLYGALRSGISTSAGLAPGSCWWKVGWLNVISTNYQQVVERHCGQCWKPRKK